MGKSTQPNLPLVLVVWNDAHTQESPVDSETIGPYHKPEVIHTLGWLLADDEVGVSVVNEFYDESYRGLTFIPRGMIISVNQYQLTKKRSTKVKMPEA